MKPNDLVDYGIQKEKVDFHLHVCPLVRRLYIFSHYAGIKAIESGQFPLVNGYTDKKYLTATGYLVPPHLIDDCKIIQLPDELWETFVFDDSMSLQKRGNVAVDLVIEAAQLGYLAIPLFPIRINTRNEQLNGIDMELQGEITLQIKCDYKGGHKQLGGSGNLFLQVSERRMR